MSDLRDRIADVLDDKTPSVADPAKESSEPETNNDVINTLGNYSPTQKDLDSLSALAEKGTVAGSKDLRYKTADILKTKAAAATSPSPLLIPAIIIYLLNSA